MRVWGCRIWLLWFLSWLDTCRFAKVLVNFYGVAETLGLEDIVAVACCLTLGAAVLSRLRHSSYWLLNVLIIRQVRNPKQIIDLLCSYPRQLCFERFWNYHRAFNWCHFDVHWSLYIVESLWLWSFCDETVLWVVLARWWLVLDTPGLHDFIPLLPRDYIPDAQLFIGCVTIFNAKWFADEAQKGVKSGIFGVFKFNYLIPCIFLFQNWFNFFRFNSKCLFCNSPLFTCLLWFILIIFHFCSS